MIDYALNYLEENGVCSDSLEEQVAVEKGIEQYLLENGIDKNENRPYFKKYVMKHLELIDPRDLKSYFLLFPILSEINQIIVEIRNTSIATDEQKKQLYIHMEKLERSSIGEKYIPIIEIKQILGRLS